MADADFSVKAIISAQTYQFEKGMKNAQTSINSMSKSIEGVQKLLKTAFSMVGITVGIKAVTDFGKSCVQSATQAQKAFNILDNTVRATGADAWTSTKELEEASKSLSASTNYSVTEIQKMQSVLLGFTNITGEAFNEASDAVLDMATVMGMDLTSAVQTIGKALDDPITGLDSLRRQGFKFTDEQKGELAQLVKNGKQLEAQKIILDTLATSYGGAAKAGQDSFAKQRHAVENFRDTLGGKLIPVMQVFAENSAKTLNNLTNLISKMDFTPIVNVVTNLSKIFNSAFENISNYLKKVSSEVTDFISRFNFKPIVSILDTLIGVLAGVINKFKEINLQKLEVFDKLKEALIDFSNSEIFENIVNFVNKIIDAVFFLWSEIQDIGSEIRDLIVNKIIEIWNKIKEFFQNSQNALSQSGQDIASWGDLFYDILNNSFKIFQDFFGMIKALIHGDWSVAWEYAKLTVMRVADNILDLISTIANAFPNLINEMINGLNVLISELNKVRGWFGKDPLGLVQAFESVDLSKKSGLEDKIKETENKIEELTGHTADVAIKDLQGVSTQFAGFTQHALGFIENLTDGVATETEKQKKYFSSTTSSGESSYEKFSEWDSKLLQQRLEGLSEWSNEALKINLQLIEEERKKAFDADKTGKDTEKINKYYDKKIKDAKKSYYASLVNLAKDYAKQVVTTFANIAKGIVQGFQKAFSLIKNIFSTAMSIFEMNPDEILDNLLKIEDTILTFFTETLPKFPQFIDSAIQSIVTLLNSLINNIDWKQINNIITSLIKVFIDNGPKIIKIILDLVINIIESVIDGFINFVESGGWKTLLNMLLTIQKRLEKVVVDNINDIVDTIVDMLPDLVQMLIDSIVSASRTLAKLIKPIIHLVMALIEAVLEVMLSDDVMDAGLEVLTELVEAIISEFIPRLAVLIVKFIPKIAKSIIASFPKLVVALVKGFVQAFTKTNWIQVVKDIFTGFVEGIKDFFGIHSPSTLFESFGVDMIKGLWNGIKNLGSWLWNNVTSFFSNLVSGIKGCFNGIGEWFGNLFSGIFNKLGEWFGNCGDAIKNALSFIGDKINGLISNTKGLFTTIGEKIKGFGETIWEHTLGHFFATGTNAAPRGLAVVGEQGPELVKFRGGEQVINNKNTQKLLAGANGNTNNFNVTFNNLQDTSAFAMMNQLKQYNRQMAINGII